MASIGTLLSVELTKLWRRPMTWVLGLIFIGFFVFLYGSLIAALVGPELEGFDKESLKQSLFLPDGVYFGAALISSLGTILLIILAAGNIGSEFSWGTIRPLVLIGGTRDRLLIAKLLALLVVALVATVVGMGLSLLGAWLAGLVVGGAPPASEWVTGGFLGDIARSTLLTYITLAVWMVIAAAITLMTHSLAAGLGITLALNLLGGQIAALIGLLGKVGTWISRVFPNAGLNALNALLQADPPDYVATDWLWITANVVGWTLLFIIVSWAGFRRLDLLAASKG